MFQDEPPTTARRLARCMHASPLSTVVRRHPVLNCAPTCSPPSNLPPSLREPPHPTPHPLG
eukprot:5531996-Prymnesium_polylepis.1